MPVASGSLTRKLGALYFYSSSAPLPFIARNDAETISELQKKKQ